MSRKRPGAHSARASLRVLSEPGGVRKRLTLAFALT